MIFRAKKVKNGYLIPLSKGLQNITEKVLEVDVKIKKTKIKKETSAVKTGNKAGINSKTYKELRNEAIMEHYLEKEKRKRKSRKVTREELDLIRKNFGLEDINSFEDVIKKCK